MDPPDRPVDDAQYSAPAYSANRSTDRFPVDLPDGSPEDETTEHVVRLELSLLDPAVRADARRLDQILHADFTEHGASGRMWTRQAIVDELLRESSDTRRTAASDLRAFRVADDAVLVTYRTTSSTTVAVRSSLWLRRATGEWQIRFHQGTPVATD